MAEEENHVFETNEEISENTDKKKSKKTVLENFSKIKDKQSNVRVKSGAILLEYLSQIGDEVSFCIFLIAYLTILQFSEGRRN